MFCLILFYNFLFIIQSKYIISFYKKYNILNIDNFDFIDYLYNNSNYFNLSIGNPIQNLTCNLVFENCFFYISEDYFNYKLSNTYKINDNENIIYLFSTQYFVNGIDSIESINLNNSLKDNLSFILVNKKDLNKDLNIKNCNFGLQLGDNDYNIIMQLKEKNITNSNIFYFNYNENDDNGYLIIDKINNNENMNVIQTSSKWKINFDNIQINNYSLSKIFEVELSIEFNGILGTKEYLKIINTTFFNKNKCSFIKNNVYNYFYYICEKNINLKLFPKLIFYLKNINYNFEFTYNELFKEINNKYYFLIIFHSNILIKKWIFGEIFLKKYKLFFDYDNKIILFEKKIKKNKIKFKLTYLIIILLICIILILLKFIINLLLKHRKIKAYELEENFDYNFKKI